MREDGLPTIGLALIVKDEEKTLPYLLDSFGLKAGPKGQAGKIPEDAAVDHVVVVDTGSEDDTRAIARRYGCQVKRFKWCDDFSKARQASYDAMPDEIAWTVWADADDVIENAHLLRQLAAQAPLQIAGFICRYDYAQDPAGNTICELWRERLVRHNIGERWKLPIHEVLEVPGPLVHNHEVVWHHRHQDTRKRDPRRNYTILKRDYEESEEPDPRTIAYLGTEAIALGEPEEAAGYFREYLDHPATSWDEERCQVAHKLSIALRHQKEPDLDGSAESAFQAISIRPDWPEGYLDLAEIAVSRQEWENVLRFCEIAERLERPKTLLIVNPLEYTYQPLLLRSVALAHLGRVEDAWEATQKVIAMTPYRDDLQRQAMQIQSGLARKKATDHLLSLREILVRHDENWKANVLMRECAPYFIHDDPEVASARLDQREMTLHATDPEVYSAYYRDNPGEAPFELQGVPIEEAHERFHRVKFLRDGIKEQVAA